MLQALCRAALGTGFTFLMTTLGAALVFFFSGAPEPRCQKGMLGFAAGVMTAASVWSLLLPAIERAEAMALPAWLPAAGGMLLGAVFLAALDEALTHLRGMEQRRETLLMTAITLHNIPEGMAVGLAFALAADGAGLAGAAAPVISGAPAAAAETMVPFKIIVVIGIPRFPKFWKNKRSARAQLRGHS